MPAAVPLIAVVAGAVGSAAVGGGIIGALVGAGAAIGVSLIGGAIFPQKKPRPPSFSGGSSAQEAQQRTQSFRQPIAEHQIVLGRAKVSGPIVFLHSSTDDEGRADGFFHMVVVLAGHRVRSIGDLVLGDKPETDPSFAGLVRVDRHLGHPEQAANGNLIAETGGKWTADHRGRGDHLCRGLEHAIIAPEGHRAVMDGRCHTSSSVVTFALATRQGGRRPPLRGGRW